MSDAVADRALMMAEFRNHLEDYRQWAQSTMTRRALALASSIVRPLKSSAVERATHSEAVAKLTAHETIDEFINTMLSLEDYATVQDSDEKLPESTYGARRSEKQAKPAQA